MEITSGISKDFLRFDSEMKISEMIGSLKKAKQKTGLVFRSGKYVGVVEKKRLLRVNLDPTTMKVGTYLHAAPVINEHADVIETAYQMHKNNADIAPIASGNEIVGVLPVLNLLKSAAELPETAEVRVGDVRFLKNLKLAPTDPLSKALEIMFEERVDEVPIFDEKGLYGILSFQDVLQKYMAWPAKREFSAKMKKEKGGSRAAQVDYPTLGNLPVSSFSTNENVVSTDIKNTFSQAISMMVEKKVSCLPVYSGKQYLGLLTSKNLLRFLASLEVPQNFNIQFVGLNGIKLSSYEIESVKKVAANESFKLQRLIHNDFKLNIHLKSYNKEGKRQKFSVTMRVNYPGKMVECAASDWDLIAALRETFGAAGNEFKKMYRQTQNRKKVKKF